MDATDEVQTFRCSNGDIAGDVVVLVLLLPIGALAVFLLLAIAVEGLADLMGPWVYRPGMVGAALTAVVIVAIAARRLQVWSLTLDHDALVVGRLWPQHVPYDQIRYLKTGASSDARAAIRRRSSDLIPLSFSTGLFGTRRIFLPFADAHRCLQALYARCPNAGAIDTNGDILLPRNPSAVRAAEFRLAETLAVRGIAALTTALAVPVVMALSFWPDKTGNPVRDVEYHARRLVVVLVYGGLVVPMLTYGWRCLRLARRVLRGDTA